MCIRDSEPDFESSDDINIVLSIVTSIPDSELEWVSNPNLNPNPKLMSSASILSSDGELTDKCKSLNDNFKGFEREAAFGSSFSCESSTFVSIFSVNSISASILGFKSVSISMVGFVTGPESKARSKLKSDIDSDSESNSGSDPDSNSESNSKSKSKSEPEGGSTSGTERGRTWDSTSGCKLILFKVGYEYSKPSELELVWLSTELANDLDGIEEDS